MLTFDINTDMYMLMLVKFYIMNIKISNTDKQKYSKVIWISTFSPNRW